MTRLTQRTKRWVKKPKVNPDDPNRIDGHGYYNNHWDFSTLNRDRPSGHTPTTYDKGYEEFSAKSIFYLRRNAKFFIEEGLEETTPCENRELDK